MRKTILREGVIDGKYFFKPGSLYLNWVVPIIYGGWWDRSTVLGYATDLKLDDKTGGVTVELSFYLSMYEKMAQPEGDDLLWDYTIQADRLEGEVDPETGVRIITSCRLRAVIVTSIARTPLPIKELRHA